MAFVIEEETLQENLNIINNNKTYVTQAKQLVLNAKRILSYEGVTVSLNNLLNELDCDIQNVNAICTEIYNIIVEYNNLLNTFGEIPNADNVQITSNSLNENTLNINNSDKIKLTDEETLGIIESLTLVYLTNGQTIQEEYDEKINPLEAELKEASSQVSINAFGAGSYGNRENPKENSSRIKELNAKITQLKNEKAEKDAENYQALQLGLSGLLIGRGVIEQLEKTISDLNNQIDDTKEGQSGIKNLLSNMFENNSTSSTEEVIASLEQSLSLNELVYSMCIELYYAQLADNPDYTQNNTSRIKTITNFDFNSMTASVNGITTNISEIDLFSLANYLYENNDIENYQIILETLSKKDGSDFEKYFKDYLPNFTKEETERYFYLLNAVGENSASKYLTNKFETINERIGEKEAQAIIDGLDNNNSNVADTIILAIKGFGSGLDNFYAGLSNLIDPDGKKSSDDYKAYYLIDKLTKLYGEDEVQKVIATSTYEIFTSIGNMIPSIGTSAIMSIILPGSGIAAFSGTALMGTSAAGNATEQALQMGYTEEKARLYGLFTGLSEASLQYLLGGIPGLSKLTEGSAGAIGFFKNMLSEGMEESTQEIVDWFLQSVISGEIQELSGEAVLKSGIYGAITAGLMGGSIIFNDATIESYSDLDLLYNGDYNELLNTLSPEQQAKVRSFLIDNNITINGESVSGAVSIQQTLNNLEKADAALLEEYMNNNPDANLKAIANNEEARNTLLDSLWKAKTLEGLSNEDAALLNDYINSDSNVNTNTQNTILGSSITFSRDSFNIKNTYSGYNYVFQNNDNLDAIIEQINVSNYEGKILIQLNNISEITRENLENLSDNVDVRVIGGYNDTYMNGLKSPNGTNVYGQITYSKSELTEILKEIEEFKNGINSNWNDYQKAYYAYEYLQNNLQYHADPPATNVRGKEYDSLLSLVKKDSTCIGYAYTYKELLNLMGINCEVIGGKLNGTGQHGYNIVTIGSDVFLVDSVKSFLKSSEGVSGFGVVDLNSYTAKNNTDLLNRVNISNSQLLTKLSYEESNIKTNIETNEVVDIETIDQNLRIFLEEKVPNYDKVITKSDIIEVSNTIEKLNNTSKLEEFLLNKGMSSNSGIDYTNDFEKASARRVALQSLLTSQIEQLNNKVVAYQESEINRIWC